MRENLTSGSMRGGWRGLTPNSRTRSGPAAYSTPEAELLDRGLVDEELVVQLSRAVGQTMGRLASWLGDVWIGRMRAVNLAPMARGFPALVVHGGKAVHQPQRGGPVAAVAHEGEPFTIGDEIACIPRAHVSEHDLGPSDHLARGICDGA